MISLLARRYAEKHATTRPRLLQELRSRVPAPVEAQQPLPNGLSPREFEVLQLLAAGRSNQEIAAELRGMVVDPHERAAQLIDEDLEVSVRVLDPSEVGQHEVGAVAHEELGRVCMLRGATRSPGAAVHVPVDGRLLAGAAQHVERLDRRAAIRIARRRSEPREHVAAGGIAPLEELLDVRCKGGLIVRAIEGGLVHVEPHELRRVVRLLGRHGTAAGESHGAREQGATAQPRRGRRGGSAWRPRRRAHGSAASPAAPAPPCQDSSASRKPGRK